MRNTTDYIQAAFGIDVQMSIHLEEIQISNAVAVPVCPTCKTVMRLFGIETDVVGRVLLSFECAECQHIETTTDRYQ